MMRIIGALMIISASGAAGMRMSEGLKKRADTLDELIAALNHLKANICFSDAALEKALRRAGEAVSCGELFFTAADNMKHSGVNEAWNAAVRGGADRFCLKSADVSALTALGERLGRTDAEDQKRNIDGVLANLGVCRADARSEYEKNGRLFRGGGILCGMLAALLLI